MSIKTEMEWFNLNKLMSENPQTSLFFILGARSDGKTYSFKQWAIKSFFRTGNEFMYLRRTSEEVNASKSNLFRDIEIDMKVEIKVSGSVYYIRKAPTEDVEDYVKWDKETEWHKFGYIYALAEQQAIRSSSFPLVNKICFDEFIISDSNKRYIPDEVTIFLDLISTVVRYREDFKVVCFSNSKARVNPYFSKYGVSSIELETNKFVRRNNNNVVFYKYLTIKNSEILKNSFVGRIAPDDYANYAFKNTFDNDDDNNILESTEVSISNPIFNILIGTENYVMYNLENGKTLIKKRSEIDGIPLYNTSPRGRGVFRSDLIKRLRTSITAKNTFFLDKDSYEKFYGAVM